MKKQELSAFFRRIHLARFADTIRFYLKYVVNFRKNNQFRKQYPGAPMPPNYLMYESFQMDRYKYFVGGKEDAEWVVDSVKSFIKLNSINVLDWGCGPARIIRHMPSILGDDNHYFGTDYNVKTINWCKKNFPNISFSLNGLKPPLQFGDNLFDLIYGISVLTHLSEENQWLWSKELNRILGDDGIILLTTHGEAFKELMLPEEIERFDKNELVIRKNVIEGHRMYGAFHPPDYMRDVFEKFGFIVADHLPGKRVHATFISQDRWLLQKRKKLI